MTETDPVFDIKAIVIRPTMRDYVGHSTQRLFSDWLLVIVFIYSSYSAHSQIFFFLSFNSRFAHFENRFLKSVFPASGSWWIVQACLYPNFLHLRWRRNRD